MIDVASEAPSFGVLYGGKSATSDQLSTTSSRLAPFMAVLPRGVVDEGQPMMAAIRLWLRVNMPT